MKKISRRQKILKNFPAFKELIEASAFMKGYYHPMIGQSLSLNCAVFELNGSTGALDKKFYLKYCQCVRNNKMYVYFIRLISIRCAPLCDNLQVYPLLNREQC